MLKTIAAATMAVVFTLAAMSYITSIVADGENMFKLEWQCPKELPNGLDVRKES